MKNPLFIEKAYINGKFISSKKTFEVLNPSTQKVVGTVPDLSIKDCQKAIVDAENAWFIWRDASVGERTAAVRKMFELVNSYKNQLAELITAECGKPFEEALTEVAYGNSFLEWFAEEAKRAYGENIPSQSKGLRLSTIKQPVGVVAAITPWNFPLAMLTRKVAPALAAGCTIIVKPASQTPFTALALAKIAEEAGIPKGVFNVLTSKDSKGIGKELATNPRIRKLTFTGSTSVGSTLMEQAAGTIKRVSMELGGNAPFLVFEDADLNKAVQGAVAGKFRNAGQTCVAVNRFYVHEKIYDEFSKKLAEAVKKLQVGDGMKKGVQVGPLINQSGLDKVVEHVEDALQKGAKVLAGGKAIKGFFYEPTVLVHVSNDALIAQEETFGPVCALFTFSSEEEGIRLANDTPFGLAAYFYSENIHRCQRVSEQLESGMVGVNTGLVSNAAAPFGGVKQSGVGREGSKHGLDEYLEIKYICYGS
ncbi:NAD-dependent succinate-semialdehyde dehydrogenase [Sphingobacterium hungaricum]|uniref:Succinate-semialdehyde dehydrogenase (NADP(+)) n=1 Tax=Sphingobacterium hungaricum TaxID=2082723 RepID=A0A928YSP4_9SPHI|nr:NAD-dependent succinate-semialdehyde dehydrogenase [Sphingobacterium hungaricum]MBE8715500.1 succinate-semialdehyde dehydrogenase (NADP(+)) [Sphingobacterium hungaricum]